MAKKLLSLLTWVFLGSLSVFAQAPANDTPCNATNFGSLPTPGPCQNGLQNGATVTFNNLSTVGATGASPYVYLTGCSGGGNQQAPALDVWYTFTATGTSVNLSIAGFPNASVAIWTGTCNNLTGVGCLNAGNGGSGTFSVTQIVVGQQYWVQVSGGTTTATDNNFSLTLDNDIDCNDCLTSATLTANPPPVNGGYVANQTVTFCYTVTGWTQVNTNWFHGVQITYGPGWTGGIQNPVPAQTLQNIPGPGSDGDWLFYPAGIGTVNGVNWGPGFYFDTPDAGTNPNNNYGDNCGGANCTWTFCWDMTVGACSPGTSLNVTVNTSGDGESGSWVNNACNDDDATNFVAVEICCTPPTITGVNVTCPGGTNGSATATGLGSSPWDYQWSNGTTVNNVAGSHTINNLAPGTYTVTVTDNANCVSTAQVTITAPAAITATPAVVNVLCNGGTTGSITMNGVSGGTPGYQYSLNGGPYQGSNVFNNLPAGTYTVTIRDNAGCIQTFTNIVITQPAVIAATPVVVNVLCNGGTTGSITVNNVTGGTPGYQYSLNGGPYQGSNVFNNLPAGTYTITVRDLNGCIRTYTNIIITQPSAITGTAASTPATCTPGNDGTITVSGASGGAGGYQYSIGGPYQAGTLFTGLAGGTYNVTIRDINGCTYSFPITVTVPGGVTASAAVTNVSCNGGNNGQIIVTANSSNPPLQYSLNGGPNQLSNTFSGLSAGPFSITVTDNVGCTYVLTGNVTQPAPLTATATVGNVSCAGGSNGTITMTGVSGGTPGYQYSLNGGPWQPGGSFTGLTAGTYTVVIRDARLCTLTVTNIVISQPQPITAIATPTNITCNGSNNGTITVSGIMGGNGTYQVSLNGGPFQSGLVFNGLSAGTYSVTVQDGNNCTYVINNIVISEPAAVAGTATSTQASCVPGNDGTITVTSATGGNGTYQYSIGGAFQSGTTFTGLASGTYTVTIQDGNNCTYSFPVTVNQAAGVTASAAGTNVSCNGGSDGQIVVTASSADLPLQYSLNGGPNQAGNTFTGLAAGPYSITVTDNAGCTDIVIVNITEPAVINATATTTGASCAPGNDGSITVVGASGGTGPYQYAINGGTYQVSNVFTGLNGGVYNVTVQDSLGCTYTFPATVSSPGAVTGSATSTAVTCNGGNNGTITATGSSANPPLQYSLNGGPLQSGNTFSNLSAGSYTVLIQDALGCSFTTIVQVIEPTALVGADTAIHVTCNGLSNGEIQIVGMSGGNPGYQYSLNGGAWQPSNVFSNLPAGTYTVVVQDQNLCSVTFNNIVVSQPNALAAQDSMVQASCNAGNDGEIWVVNVAGGTPGYQYSLNGGPLQPGNGFTGLTPGNYTILVQDQNGCQFTFGSTVTQVGGLTAVDSVVNPTCFGFADGEIWILTSGGANPINYSLNGGPAQASNFFTGLGAGSYTIVVNDGNNCTVNLSVALVEPPLLVGTLSSTNPSCFGGSNGSVTLNNAAGGTPGYQFSLNGGPLQAGNTFSGLPGGSYSITIQDANGCTSVFGPAILTEPSEIMVTSTSTDVTCNGGTNGSVALAANGGTPGYTYSIDGVTFQAGSTFSGLTAGIYTLTVRDNLGCTVTILDTVAEPTAIQLSTSTTPSICGNGNGSMTVDAVGGTPGYSYLWLLGGGNTATTQTVNNVTPGAFTVIVTDNNGCSDTTTATVVGIGGPVISVSNLSNPNCFGESTGFAVASVSSGSAPFTYLWSNGGTLDSIGGLPSGSYTVWVTDSLGCMDSATVLLRDPSLFVIAGDSTTITCFGTNDGSVTALPTGGTPGYQVLWNTGDTTNTLNNLGGGTYTAVATDANGCTDTIRFTLVEPRQVVAAFSSNPSIPAVLTIEEANVSFINESVNASIFHWEFGDGDTTSEENPTHLYTVVGYYCPSLIATDTTGCQDTLTTCAFTIIQEPLVIPNTFTPNDDGTNDFFEIEGIKQFPNNKLMIFNRWGNLIYESAPYNNDWDGTNFRNGQPLPDGGYFYILETGVEGQKNFQGDVVIFR